MESLPPELIEAVGHAVCRLTPFGPPSELRSLLVLSHRFYDVLGPSNAGFYANLFKERFDYHSAERRWAQVRLVLHLAKPRKAPRSIALRESHRGDWLCASKCRAADQLLYDRCIASSNVARNVTSSNLSPRSNRTLRCGSTPTLASPVPRARRKSSRTANRHGDL